MQCFTPLDITKAFCETCEFQIHPTNAGMILKEKNINPIGYTKEGNKLYDGSSWELVFSGLYKKALNKCQAEETPPRDDKSVPDCPEYLTEDILSEKPYIDFTQNLVRVDIKVPFECKEVVKNLGAKWDSGKKTWYFFKGDDDGRFSQWLPKDSKD